MLHSLEEYKDLIPEFIENRDVKGIMAVCRRALRDAGSDPTTSHSVQLTLGCLSASRRDWDDIRKWAYRSISDAQKALASGVGDGNLSDHEDHLISAMRVRCAEAKQRLGMIPVGACCDQPEEAKKAVQPIQEYLDDLLKLTEP